MTRTQLSGHTLKLATLALAGLTTRGALAQVDRAAPARPTQLPAFGRSVAGVEDASATVVNPANLAFLQAGELRWSSAYLDDRALQPWQGHAVTFAAPIPFLSLATAIRLDTIDPPAALSSWMPDFRANYQWLSGALGFRVSDATALGVSYKHAYSENARIDGVDAWSFGISARPASFLGMSLVAFDVGSPDSRSGQAYAASYDMALAVRPLGSRALEIGLEGKYLTERGGYWIPRATLGVDIPNLGRVRGEFSMLDPAEETTEKSWMASALMSFVFNGTAGSMELGTGSVFGSALGSQADSRAHQNLLLDVAFKSYREPAGIGPPVHAIRLRIEETPNVRDHVALLRKLWAIAEGEPQVAGVVLELRDSPAESLAHVQELRDAIHHLRTRGKQVLCHLEDADGAALYLCAAANRILINPAGGIRFAGLRAQYFYYRSLLDKLGVRGEFVRIGDHKTAPEAFLRDGASDVGRADKIDLLNQFDRYFTLSVARGRNIESSELRKRIAKGPFIAEEARAAGLVDALAFDDQVQDALGELVGGRVSLVDEHLAPKASNRFGAVPGIALIYVHGDMVDGKSRTIPLLGMHLAGSYSIAESLQRARKDPLIGAVVLRIETGGGSALAADVLWREVELTSEIKPVIVSMGSAAASGGYYIASPATRIFANPLSVTGSIGIFSGKADVSELLRRIGVTVEVYKTTPAADADAFYRPYTPGERAALSREVASRYDLFLARVAHGRKLQKAEVDSVGQGRVWTGEQALAHRLVDELGGLRQALEHARSLAELPSYAPIVELPPEETSLLGRLLGIEGVRGLSEDAIALPAQLVDLARALAPFAIHPGDTPLARMEISEVRP